MAHFWIDVFRADDFWARFGSRLEFEIHEIGRKLNKIGRKLTIRIARLMIAQKLTIRIVCTMIAIQLTLLI